MAPKVKHINLKKRNAALAGVWDEASMHTIKQTRLATHTVITDAGNETTTFVLPTTPSLLLAPRSPQDSMPPPSESLPPEETKPSEPTDDFPRKKTQVSFILRKVACLAHDFRPRNC